MLLSPALKLGADQKTIFLTDMIRQKDKKVLVVGSGGRCHAIVDALGRSERVEKIYCAPGNAGICRQAECVAIGVEDIEALADFAAEKGIDLTIVGPEASLAAGVADEFEKRGLKVFGPTKSAARIESSKEFAKELMERHGIPTGSYRSFSDFDEAVSYSRTLTPPIVVKYDGLAAGKGVVVAQSHDEAEKALADMLVDASFGHDKVIIEEFLDGPEFSLMCLVNGEKVYPLAEARDHKRAHEGDQGPNTGGMGAYSPVAFITDDTRREALEKIMYPAAAALAKEGVPFRGVLYGGLVLTKEGPKVIEFNARFGDPETEVVLPRLKSDFYDLVEAVMLGRDFPTVWSDQSALGIVVASEGYPGKYAKGVELNVPKRTRSKVYHMGTAEKEGKLVSAGGRVLMTVGLAPTMPEARRIALSDAQNIAGEGFFIRRDIGGMVISGTDVAADIKMRLAERSREYNIYYGRTPHLSVILVGDDPASRRYVGNKGRAAEECGFGHATLTFPSDVSQEELLDAIRLLNEDDDVDAILVQLPLPKHIDKSKVLNAILPEKDVDAFHPQNVAALWKKEPGILPCTPKGIIRLLDEASVEISGKRAVVIGRSNIVGFPVAKMLLDRDATVTIAHSKTPDLADITREADILVVAIGQAKLITADMVKPGAAVIDVGINRDTETGGMCGDVDFEAIKMKASVITPVPGGVGPMTIASLMENTVECFLKNKQKK